MTAKTAIDLSLPEAIERLVKLTGAPRNWSDLIRLTRVSSKKTPIGTMDTMYNDSVRAQSDWRGTPSFWENGFRIIRQADGYLLCSHTVRNGSEVLNFYARVREDGTFDGYANCFGLGLMPIDRNYLLNQLEEREYDFQWDKIRQDHEFE